MFPCNICMYYSLIYRTVLGPTSSWSAARARCCADNTRGSIISLYTWNSVGHGSEIVAVVRRKCITLQLLLYGATETERKMGSLAQPAESKQFPQSRKKLPTDTESTNDDNHFIKCIMFCKFHAIAGPQIAVQVPDNYISKEVFDTINQYLIPKTQFQRSFVSL